MNNSSTKSAKVVTTLLGQQDRCFDLRFSPKNDNYLLSASEDGSVRVWDTNQKKSALTLYHNKEAEVLRATFLTDDRYIASAGADGVVAVWSTQQELSNGSSKLSGNRVCNFKHSQSDSQVYSCEVVPNEAARLMTAAESELCLWDVNEATSALNDPIQPIRRIVLKSGQAATPRGDPAVIMFDAKSHTEDPNIVAVALSDSTVRLLDLRDSSELHSSNRTRIGPAVETQSLWENQGNSTKLQHTTSVNWCNYEGMDHYCAISFASGVVGMIDFRMNECVALHQVHSSPCYGVAFVPNSNYCYSWSSDTYIRLWSIFESPCLPQSNTPKLSNYEGSIRDCRIFTACYQASTGLIYCSGENATVPMGTKRVRSFIGNPIYAIEPSFSS